MTQAPRSAEGWQAMDSEPNDGAFRWYGLHVKHTSGHEWFEAHYVQHDDGGQMRLPSGDNFDDWTFFDFEFWCNTPALPAAPLVAEPGEKCICESGHGRPYWTCPVHGYVTVDQ